jgi:hypothetical protein
VAERERDLRVAAADRALPDDRDVHRLRPAPR